MCGCHEDFWAQLIVPQIQYILPFNYPPPLNFRSTHSQFCNKVSHPYNISLVRILIKIFKYLKYKINITIIFSCNTLPYKLGNTNK